MNKIGIKQKIKQWEEHPDKPLHLHLLQAVSLCKRLWFEDWPGMLNPIAGAQFLPTRVGSTALVLLAIHMPASTCLSLWPGIAAITRPRPDGRPTIIASRSRNQIQNTQ